MSKSWATLRKRFGKGAEGEADDEVTMPKATPLPPLVPAVHEAPEPIVRPNGSLDTVGQKNELIRVRFANLVDRLDEIRSLRDDFTALSEPVFDLISSYPQVQSRLLETEAVLRQEHETMSALRRELSDLTVLQAKTADELSAAVAQLRKAEAKVREQDSILEDLRLNLKDREAMASDLENQLTIETERARSVTEENHALQARGAGGRSGRRPCRAGTDRDPRAHRPSRP